MLSTVQSIPCVMPHFVPTTALWNRYCHWSCFTGEEMKRWSYLPKPTWLVWSKAQMTPEPVLGSNTRYTGHPKTLMWQKEEASKKGKVTCPKSVTRSGLWSLDSLFHALPLLILAGSYSRKTQKSSSPVSPKTEPIMGLGTVGAQIYGQEMHQSKR